MLTLKDLEVICVAARQKGFGDSAPVKLCANASGVAAYAKIELNAAANLDAGSFIETGTGETVLEGPELVLNQPA